MQKIIFFVLLIIIMLFLSTCKMNKSNSQDLIIFHAGSLSVPLKEIKSGFNREFPNVNILLESAGSVECARKISSLNKPCDVMASADYTVIDKLLIPSFADWNIKFAANEMAIVYSKDSKMAESINKENWYKILLNEKVAFGRSDPNSDPCGYRAIMTIKLSELFYNEAGLTDKMLSKNKNFIRPKEVDLLALLETGTIDYIFLYRSVAMQHNLKYLVLPDEINLKNPVFADYYKKASVQVNGNSPGTFITQTGSPMVYGITIPKNAPNYKTAIIFLKFVLDKNKGLAIMEKNGQPPIIPCKTDFIDKIPRELKTYVAE